MKKIIILYLLFFLAVLNAKAANSLPTVSITSPQNNAMYFEDANVQIDAIASDADGTITKVEFYNGSNLIGIDYNYPYSITYNSFPAGSSSLTAVAFDNSGESSTSSAVTLIGFADATAIKSSHVSEDLNVYPNPVTGNEIRINYPVALSGSVSISIVDMNGNEKMIVSFNSGAIQSQTLDVHSLSSGFYILKIRTLAKEYQEKISIISNSK